MMERIATSTIVAAFYYENYCYYYYYDYYGYAVSSTMARYAQQALICYNVCHWSELAFINILVDDMLTAYAMWLRDLFHRAPYFCDAMVL